MMFWSTHNTSLNRTGWGYQHNRITMAVIKRMRAQRQTHCAGSVLIQRTSVEIARNKPRALNTQSKRAKSVTAWTPGEALGMWVPSRAAHVEVRVENMLYSASACK
jgi:hypothetical protein